MDGIAGTFDVPFWNHHYSAFRVDTPTDFCDFVCETLVQPRDKIIELGCGNGRDAPSLSAAGASYLGLDASRSAVALTRSRLARHGFSAPGYWAEELDMGRYSYPRKHEGRLLVYSRFSLHSVSDETQDRLLSNLLASDVPVVVAVEARSIHDELYGKGVEVGPHAFQTDHYRRFLDPAMFLNDFVSHFQLVSFRLERGLARFRDEDPVVMRAVMSRGE